MTVDTGPRGPAPGAVRRRITVRGTVQGVGFRPFVHRVAEELGLTGFVRNGPGGVIAEAEGPPAGIDALCFRLAHHPPPLARVGEVTWEPVAARGGAGFLIVASQGTGQGPERTALPPDTAICAQCLAELTEPRDRRHRHPFINCTHCGPRFTIATGLPYDRDTTTMGVFPMCPACRTEYEDPRDRRFHAQPVACPDCGPRLRLSGPGDHGDHRDHGDVVDHGDDAVLRARALLARGAILAVKSLGGYHLVCDAGDEVAVRALRSRKERGGKPFAVMCRDLESAGSIARLGEAERAVLTGPRRPVVLLPRNPGGPLAAGVCPGSPHVGLMLPYTPLHHLLLGLDQDPAGPRILVMTSGNRSGEPIVTDDVRARGTLAGIADAWLWYDREIAVGCDDSVVRVRRDGTTVVLRRSRGYTPDPLPLPVPVPRVLALGGDLKNTRCSGAGREAWFTPHIGDLAELATERAADRAERRMAHLTGATPEVLAADLHPGYRSTGLAARRASDDGLPLYLVQHHHAHIASLMAQHGLDGTRPVIGVAFDGTGYGTDGAIWGGEVLLADYHRFERAAHLAYVPLPGGDAGVANPCRMALAHLRRAGLPWGGELPCARACSPAELRNLRRQLERGLACVPTSSMGRLFDAVSSLAGICHRAGYEAQAALELEAAAGPAREAGREEPYALRLAAAGGGAPLTMDPAPVLAAIVRDLGRGVPAALIAARFHAGVALTVAQVCRRVRLRTGTGTVGLTGGVFANDLLESHCTELLESDGFTVLRHHEVPPGDGGLALGQLAVAAARHRAGEEPAPLAEERSTPCASQCPEKS
ncbi:carbamoyltransferase HypF [Streptomyces sp. NPDC051018]|uniref:carbamoyltransferase HypF n=1 Tax=Streptomyces sp. NPDC051018 TaxID=3365639 RepID=UPI0037904B69